jgi:hypothetical protein
MLKSKSRLYVVWRGMKERCTNPNHKNYILYKDKLCKDWFDSEVFFQWAKENGYEDGLTIDRIDSTKGYFPENCQFLTARENTIKGNKERRLKTYKYNGSEFTCKELSVMLEIDRHRLHQYLNRQNHSIEECIQSNKILKEKK